MLAIVTALTALFCAWGWYCTHEEKNVRESPQDTESRFPTNEGEEADELRRIRDDARVTSYQTSEELPETASELVLRYRDQRDCMVRSAGYIDMLGNAWSCLMEGPGWVDLCVVLQGDEGCSVQVIRMEVKDWEESYGHQKEDEVWPIDR